MAGLKSHRFKTKTGSEGHSQQTAGLSAARRQELGWVWHREVRRRVIFGWRRAHAAAALAMRGGGSGA